MKQSRIVVTMIMVAMLKNSVFSLELITDNHFQTGVIVNDPVTGAAEGPMQYTATNGAPKWALGQWNSLGSIYKPRSWENTEDYGIVSNRVKRSSNVYTPVWNTTYQTLNGTDQSFTLAVTTQLDTLAPSGNIAVLFNVQDADNFYQLRYFGNGTVQVVRRVNEVNSQIAGYTGFVHVKNRAYRLEVFSDTPYRFNASITDTVTDTVVWSANNIVDSQSRFTGGYAGFMGGAVHTWDDFSLNSASEGEFADNFNWEDGALNSVRIFASGAHEFHNEYKSVVMGPVGTEDGDLILAPNAIAEWGGVYREAGAPLPHLLLGHLMWNHLGADLPWLSDLEELIFDIELKLHPAYHVYDEDLGYNRSIHAAYFRINLAIQNRKLPRDSNPDYGKFYNFNIRFYDDRVPLPGPNALSVLSCGNILYPIGLSFFTDEGMIENEWKRVRGDILAEVKAGLQACWDAGLLTNSFDYADYQVAGLNMGWEVPGMSDVAMQIRNFSVQAYGLDHPRPYEFNTDGDQEGWTYANMTDLGNPGPTNGTWILSVPGSDPHLIGPAIRVDADTFTKVKVRIANEGNPAGASYADLFWKRNGDASFSSERGKRVPISNDGSWAEYTFDMTDHSLWQGEITQLRLDPVISGDGNAIGVDYIRFSDETGYTDDFNRASGPLGDNWANAGDYRIELKRAVNSSSVYTPVWHTPQTLNGTNFTLAVTTQLNTLAPSGNIAVLFNVQDADNFYQLRYTGTGTVQVVRRVNGVNSQIAGYTDAFTHVQNRAYRLEVFSDTPYTFNAKITDTVTETVVWSANNITDSQSNFTGGYAGFMGGDVHTWDDFSLTVISEP